MARHDPLLRDTDMPISEVARYHDLAAAGDHTAADRMALLIAHDHRVSDRIDRLIEQRTKVRRKIGWYAEHHGAA